MDAPAQGPVQRERLSKLDPFKGHIAEWLEKDPRVTAAVIEQRLRPLGYPGGPASCKSTCGKCVRNSRPSAPLCEWNHLPANALKWTGGTSDSLDYSGDQRKLYAFALVDAHSRMLYVEFTHSQSFRNFRPLPHSRFHCAGRRRQRNRL